MSNLTQKWKPILDHTDMPPIAEASRRNVVAKLLENQVENSASSVAGPLTESAAPTNVTGDVAKYDPVLISMVRRAMPNLIAYDTCGVQAMSGPSELIFCTRPSYVDGDSGDFSDAYYPEPNSSWSGTGEQKGSNPGVLNDTSPGDYTAGTGIATEDAEKLGSSGGTAFKEMGMEIERISVTAKSRALKASYSTEMAEDMKKIHGLEASTELSNLLATEILADINREVIRTINIIAKPGAQTTAEAGIFNMDIDSSGRWSVEKFKGLMFQIERDANAVAKETRRGKANFIICSSDIASALTMAGKLDYAPAINNNLQVDDTGNTFAGILNGRYRVYIDPYATGDFYTVGYKGSSSWDAGLYYTPYIPLQQYQTQDPETFQPKLGFKTRYGLVANPYAEGSSRGAGALTANSNVYFRRVKVENLM